MFDLKESAKACYLNIEDSKVEKFNKDITNILNMLDELSNMQEYEDNDEINYMRLRSDEIKPSLTREEILMNTKSKAGCFIVPKTLDK